MVAISKGNKKLIVKNIFDYFRESVDQEISSFNALFF